MRPLLPLLLLLPACAAPELGIDLDSDMDGLLDGEERRLGTDPGLADTDGDGYNDGYELDAYTDPLNADDRPFKGGWDMGSCRWDIEYTGNGVGEIAENFALINQHNDIVHLHDFCHKAILLLYGSVG